MDDRASPGKWHFCGRSSFANRNSQKKWQGNVHIKINLMTTLHHAMFDQALILANGAYGKRMMKICDICQIDYDANVTNEDRPVPLEDVKKWLTSGQNYRFSNIPNYLKSGTHNTSDLSYASFNLH